MIPDHSSFVLFISAAIVLLAIPGPAVFYVVGRSIGLGRSAGVVSTLGIAVGTCVHVAAAAIGMSALLMSLRHRFRGRHGLATAVSGHTPQE
jgi:threonine/homoserine/homoserine lactone efflux protein